MTEKPCDHPARYQRLPCVYRGLCNGAWEWERKSKRAVPRRSLQSARGLRASGYGGERM